MGSPPLAHQGSPEHWTKDENIVCLTRIVKTFAKTITKKFAKTFAKTITKKIVKTFSKTITKKIAKPFGKTITKKVAKTLLKTITKKNAKKCEQIDLSQALELVLSALPTFSPSTTSCLLLPWWRLCKFKTTWK